MNISLTDRQYTTAEIIRMAGDFLAQAVTKVEPVVQGANSRVYRLSSASGDYVMKFYFQHPEDPRDRLGTEFGSLSYLWAQGIRQIPQPLNAWCQQGCALYTFVKGSSVAGHLRDTDIDEAVDFIKTLKNLSKSTDYKQFNPASEAFFSAKGITDNLKARIKRFRLEDNSGEYKAMKEYLQDDFLPLLEVIEKRARKYLMDRGVLWEGDLSGQYRTLSPSDFGFHNALRTPDKGIVFLDFEYFGWDDPVKTVSDFLWHPAMNLSEVLQKRFINRMHGIFDDDPQFQTRIKALFPLFGLKWCLILLNEFVATDMQRRGFARMMPQDKTTVLLNQLAKARAVSHKIRSSYKEFP